MRVQDPRVSLATPKRFFGISGFGFTKVLTSLCSLGCRWTCLH